MGKQCGKSNHLSMIELRDRLADGGFRCRGLELQIERYIAKAFGYCHGKTVYEIEAEIEKELGITIIAE